MDADALLEQPLERILSSSRFSTSLKDRLQEQAAELRQKLSALESDLRRGYIHGDAHPVNLIFGERKACFIDLDLSGFGWLAYDIGTFSWWIRGLESKVGLYTAFITAYEEVSGQRTPTASLTLFRALRHLFLTGGAVFYAPHYLLIDDMLNDAYLHKRLEYIEIQLTA